MEDPADNRADSHIFVHGAHMLVIRNIPDGPEASYRIHTFDFSRLGSATLPLLDGNNGGIERRTVFGDGRSCVFGNGSWMGSLESLGDSIIVRIVSVFSHSTGGGVAG